MSLPEPAVAVPELTHGIARGVCALACERFAVAGRLWLHVGDLGAVDVVGLAALLQVVRRGSMLAAPIILSGGVTLRRTLVDAHLADDVRLLDVEPRVAVAGVTVSSFASTYVVAGRRVGLRPPGLDDIPLFVRWAADQSLHHLVGSDLLYLCRHLREDGPVIRDALLADPTALTLLVEPLGEPRRVIGYVRLYHVRLGEGFAFLETAITESGYRWVGCGVEATRLLLAYGLDALELNRIEAKVYAYNTQSCNALRRRGFREEGRLHEAHVVGDQRVDVIVFGMFGDDMRARRRRDPLPYLGLWPAP
jgi:RimJ/RimL family protein N-acetyltransferase